MIHAQVVWTPLSLSPRAQSIRFYSNAKVLWVRYQVRASADTIDRTTCSQAALNLRATGTEGLTFDVPSQHLVGDTLVYTFTNTKPLFHRHGRGYEYRLALPLLKEVKWMQIGVSKENSFSFIPLTIEPPIVIYGSALSQGKGASQPFKAWVNQVQEALDYRTLNFSETVSNLCSMSTLRLMVQQPVRLFILSNLIRNPLERTDSSYCCVAKAIRFLQEKQPLTPILVVGYGNGSHKAFTLLRKQSKHKVCFLSNQEIAIDSAEWMPSGGLSDTGMVLIAQAVEQKVRELLSIPKGQLTTTTPVKQRRQPQLYEWLARHEARLKRKQKHPPVTVLVGNSITHFWGGYPMDCKRNGETSWENVMAPAGCENFGYGWDRIENALWRIYHDELSGYSAKQIILMLGTNNLGTNTDEEIVRGLGFLIDEIKVRQPKAEVRMMGIFPRRGQEVRVRTINVKIEKMAFEHNVVYQDVSDIFIKPDGTVDPTFFLNDGLHPNQKGYNRLAKSLAPFLK